LRKRLIAPRWCTDTPAAERSTAGPADVQNGPGVSRTSRPPSPLPLASVFRDLETFVAEFDFDVLDTTEIVDDPHGRSP
jgi:hypothetical protein